MPPLPAAAAWNPLAPIQNNWDKIEPWQKGYMSVIGGLGTVFTFAATIALIVEHKGKPPKWPFTSDRWNPKPTVDSDKEEVTAEQIVEDELAQVVGTINKRGLPEDELEWFDDNLLKGSIDGKDLKEAETVLEDVEQKSDVVEHDVETIGDEIKDIVNVVEEVGEEIWKDIKEIFGPKKNETKTEKTPVKSNFTAHAETRSAVSRKLI